MINPHPDVFEKAALATGIVSPPVFPQSLNKPADYSFLTRSYTEDLAGRYKLPDLDTLAGMGSILNQKKIVDAIGHYGLEIGAVSRAMEELTSPWLDLNNKIGSVSGLTGLQGIGHVLASMPGFGADVTSVLRHDLGDWRGPLMLDPSKFLDPVARSNFYISRGFDRDLTAFPSTALRENLESAGLLDACEATENHDDEAAFMRTNEAHDRLMRFEVRLRIFIDKAMTISMGPDWIKSRVPGDMRESWKKKQKASNAAGEIDRPLIDYADFTDYLKIIIQKNNWNDVFAAMFQHKASVEESFRRLYPVRICTMHARPISNDDALYLLVEIKRLSQAIEFD